MGIPTPSLYIAFNEGYNHGEEERKGTERETEWEEVKEKGRGEEREGEGEREG